MTQPARPTNFRGASRARSCQGKQAFADAGSAERAMRALRRAGRLVGEANAYHCRFCGLWHWGGTGGQQSRFARTLSATDRALRRDGAKRSAASGQTADKNEEECPL